MSSARNGQEEIDRDPDRRLRFDDMAAIVARNSPGPRAVSPANVLPPSHSGRRFVLVAGLVVLVLWGLLYVIFRDWRTRYRQRAQYGVTQIVPAIEPLRGVMPPGVDLRAWREAVDQTRALLITVTGSNLLSLSDMDTLRTELVQHVGRACAKPATAVGELAAIWNEIADRGEFLFRDSRSLSGDRHPRPLILPPRPAKSPEKTSPPPVR